MNDERKQGEHAVNDPAVGPFEVDEKFQHRSRQIARIILRRMNRDPEEAEDVVQEAYLRLLHIGAEERNGIKNPTAYFHKTVRNVILNRIRKQRSYVVDSLDSLDTHDLLDSDRNLAENPDFNIPLLLREIWRQFEGEDRRLFELIAFGYDSREVAFRLGISDEAARQRVSRLKAKIKAILAGKGVSR